MKNIAFALQVFAIVTVFPLYVITELHHAPMPPTEKDVAREISQKVTVVPTAYPRHKATKNENFSMPAILINTLY
jgi:hypothetical protein